MLGLSRRSGGSLRRSLCLLLVAVAGCRAPAEPRDPPSADRTLATGTESPLAKEAILAGWEALDEGDRDAARPFFEKASRADPECAIALAHRAVLESGRQGEELLRRAESIARPRAEAERVQVAILRSTKDGDPVSALAGQARLAELFPDASRSHYLLGKRLGSLARYADAKAELERALALEPEAPAPLSVLSWILVERLDDAAAALPYATRYVALRPEERSGWNLLAAARTFSGDPAGGEAAARRSLAIDERGSEAWYRLATALALQGRIEELREVLVSRVKTADGEDVIRIRGELAWAEFALGREDAAFARLAEAETMARAAGSQLWRAGVHTARGAMHSLAGRWDAASAELAAADAEGELPNDHCRDSVLRLRLAARLRVEWRGGKGGPTLEGLRAQRPALEAATAADLIAFGESEAARARGDLVASRTALERCAAGEDFCAWALAALLEESGDEEAAWRAKRAIETRTRTSPAYPFFRVDAARRP